MDGVDEDRPEAHTGEGKQMQPPSPTTIVMIASTASLFQMADSVVSLESIVIMMGILILNPIPAGQRKSKAFRAIVEWLRRKA
jgi:hypothetical protein